YAGVTRIVAGVPQLLEDLGLDGLAAFPARAGDPPMERPASPAPMRTSDGRRRDGPSESALRPGLGAPAAPSIGAVALDVPERERRLLIALDRGATTVDELA